MIRLFQKSFDETKFFLIDEWNTFKAHNFWLIYISKLIVITLKAHNFKHISTSIIYKKNSVMIVNCIFYSYINNQEKEKNHVHLNLIIKLLT